ncbi:hypothetical protein BDZ97DRAFT_1803964 [Flammula alnicola]|nr:hypothetical protein BDZ97DRAFT_1803964 [Flammula alnicola]
MSKSNKIVTPFTAHLVQFDTAVPFAEVIARLDIEVNKAGSTDVTTALRSAKTHKEYTSVVDRTAKKDFLYFMEFPHSKMLRFAEGFNQRGIISYTIGNPLLAQEILKCNPLAAYDIPPRILIVEHPGGSGCSVSYHLPSTIMGLPNGEEDPKLQAVLEVLDDKVERMVERITAE